MVVEASAGGTGRHVLDLAEGLIGRGCEVHLIFSTLRSDRIFRDRLKQMARLPRLGLPIRTTPHPSDLKFVRKIRAYMKENGPFQAIHGHSSKGGALARLASVGTDVPAFYTLHGLIMMDPTLPRWKWGLYLALELLMGRWTRAIIAVSPEESRAAVRFGFDARRLRTIPNGVGAACLAPRAVARRTLRVNPDAIVIGFVGRLVEQKAPHVLLHAFALAKMRCPNAHLAIVGSGPLEASMRHLAERIGIAENVRWSGEVDARTVLAGFDLFAISSRKEGLPYVILEAMAAGLPIIATETSGVELLIDPGKNGQTVPTDDADALGAALLNYLLDPARSTAAGKASLEKSRLFTIEAMTDATLEAYQSAERVMQPA